MSIVQTITQLYLIYGNESLIKFLFFIGCFVSIILILWYCLIDKKDEEQ